MTEILPDLIIKGDVKLPHDWEPLRHVLKQVQDDVQLSAANLKRQRARQMAWANVWHSAWWTLAIFPLFLGIVVFPGLASYNNWHYGLNADLFLFAILPMLLTAGVILGIMAISAAYYKRQILQEGVNVSFQAALRQGALQTASPQTHKMLKDAFDDAFILMDELREDESDLMIRNSMESVRRTLGGMVIGGAMVKRIDDYLESRPEHVRRSAENPRGNMGKEVALYSDLSQNRQVILQKLEDARKDLSLLRGNLLNLQADLAKEALTGARMQAQLTLEMAQSRAKALEDLNQHVLATLPV